MNRTTLIANLTIFGKEIGEKANNGDKLCQEIIANYVLWYNSPNDNMAQALVKISLEKYLKLKKEGGKHGIS